MKKNYLILSCLFMVMGIFSAKAQPSASSIPNPYTDASIISSGTKVSLYGASGKIGTFANWYETTVSNYGSSAQGVMATPDPGGWKGFQLTLSSTQSTATNKYLYFMCYNLNNTVQANNGTVQLTSVSKYAISGSSWELWVIDLPNITLASIEFQTPGSGAAYVANVCLASSPYYPPGYPTTLLEPAPAHVAAGIHSIYSDQPSGDNIISPVYSTWGAFTAVAEWTLPATTKTTYVVNTAVGGAINSGFRFEIESPVRRTQTQLMTDYRRMHLDIYSSTAMPSGLLGVALCYTSSGTSNPVKPEFISIPAVPAGTWLSFDIDVSDLVAGDMSRVITGIQFQNTAATSGSPLFVDNIYFYSPTDPDIEAPTPPYAGNIFKAVYGGLTYNAGLLSGASWTGGTSSDFTVAGKIKNQKLTLNTVAGSQPRVDIGTGSATLLNTSSGNVANALHFNVWMAQNNTTLNVLVNSASGVGTSYPVSSAGSLNKGQWHTVIIPLTAFSPSISGAAINNVRFSGTNGQIVYVDNILFYYEDGNLGPVAEVFRNGVSQGQFNSIKAAYDRIIAPSGAGLNGNVDIRVLADSKEPNQITIDLADGNVLYDNLKIYPTGVARTVTYTGAADNLFEITNSNGTKSVTIDGRLGGSGTANNSLILKSPYINDKATIALHATGNAVVQYCTFKGLAPDDRPRNIVKVTGNAVNTKILNNYFDDCLLLDAHLPSSLTDTDVQTASVVYVDGSALALTEAIEIDGNHFFESTHSYFRSPIIRSYIFVDKSSCNIANQIKIRNNKIGGSAANLGGTYPLRIGNSTDATETANSTAGDLLAINVNSQWPSESAPLPDNNSNYILIEGNEIARIEIYNTKNTGVYANNQDRLTNYNRYIGRFSGIDITDGFTLVRNNIIRNIKLISSAPTVSTDQRFFFSGICSSIFGGICRAIIEDNQLSDFTVDYTANSSSYSSLINAIFCQLDNFSSAGPSKVAATVRGNHILMGHEGTHGVAQYTDIHGISARVQNIGTHAGNAAQLDVYNNVVVLNRCKSTGGALRVISPVDILNGSVLTSGVINLYNNIITIIPNPAANAFSGVTALVAGINYVSGSDAASAYGVTNIFHNSVYLKELGTSIRTAAMNMEFRNTKTGDLSMWNNNFVNAQTNANASVYYCTSNTSSEPHAFYSDYNNYYVPANGNMFKLDNGFGSEASIKTFDNWKFSNTLLYWGGKTSEYDFHSRFLDPCFNSTTALSTFNSSVPVTTMANINNLKSLLTPKRFIAGKKTEVAALGLKVTTTTPSSHTVSATAMTNGTNMDINKSVKRRINLPTVGAVNTNFTNYLNTGTTGNLFANSIIPNTANSNPWERDIVFAVNSTGNYTIPSSMSVHDIYNDTVRNLIVGNNTLTITGYVGHAGNGRISAATATSTVVYNGNDGHPIGGKQSAAAQHIFPNIFPGNTVGNLRLNNQSQYFVLLHPADVPTNNSLIISGDFAIENPNVTEISYPGTPAWLPKGMHPGGLNCTWYNTMLQFTAATAISSHPVTAYNSGTPYTYRPYAGQRIPRHAIYNDSVYNLTVNSEKMITYHDYLYVKNNLSISASRSFEIAADKYVKVLQTTTNSGGNNGLVIKSRELETAENALKVGAGVIAAGDKSYLFREVPRPNATFISNTDNVPATVEMYSSAANVTKVNSATGLTYSTAWQYFTPAVNSAPLTNFTGSAGTMIYEYNPVGDNIGRIAGSPFWIGIASGTNLNTAKAYAITSGTANAKKYSMVGNLNRAPFNISAGNMKYYIFNPTNDVAIAKIWPDDEASKNQTRGTHMFGNPYTHAVAIKDIIIPSNFTQSVYIYNTGSFVNWQDGGRLLLVGNEAGKYIIVPKENAGTGELLPATISSMQPFSVKFSAIGTHNVTQAAGPLSFNYGSTTNNSGGKINTMQRSAKKDEEPLEKCILEMLFKNGNYADYLLLVGNEGTGKGFDNGWDAQKELDEMQALSLFTVEQEEDMSTAYYQVSTMADLNQTDIAILVGNNENTVPNLNSKYELLFKTKNLHQHYSQLYLEDLLTGALVDLLANEDEEVFSYEFTSNAQPGEKATRFRIVTAPGTTTNVDDITLDSRIEVYSQDQTIYIRSSKELSGTVVLYDIAGKCVLTQSFDNTRIASIKTNLSKGAYIVRIEAEGYTVNKTIILK